MVEARFDLLSRFIQTEVLDPLGGQPSSEVIQLQQLVQGARDGLSDGDVLTVAQNLVFLVSLMFAVFRAGKISNLLLNRFQLVCGLVEEGALSALGLPLDQIFYGLYRATARSELVMGPFLLVCPQSLGVGTSEGGGRSGVGEQPGDSVIEFTLVECVSLITP